MNVRRRPGARIEHTQTQRARGTPSSNTPVRWAGLGFVGLMALPFLVGGGPFAGGSTVG